jgi:hypothetical protein
MSFFIAGQKHGISAECENARHKLGATRRGFGTIVSPQESLELTEKIEWLTSTLPAS